MLQLGRKARNLKWTNSYVKGVKQKDVSEKEVVEDKESLEDKED